MKLALVVAALLVTAPAFAHGSDEGANSADSAHPNDPAKGPPTGAEPVELAEHPGHEAATPHVNWFEWSEHAPPVGWYAINFIVFVGGLLYAVRKPARDAMQKRHDSIKSIIEENQHAFDAAKLRHDTYRTKLAQVDQESRELIDSSKGDGALARDRIIAGARDYARRLRSDAETVAKNDENRARLQVQSDIARAALKSAEDMLRRGITDADRERLFEQSLQMIEQGDVSRTRANGSPTQAAGDA